jgi:hypothetical protein
MQIINKIDHLITKLTELKPALSDNLSSNEKKFNELLSSTISTGYPVDDEPTGATLSTHAKLESGVPSWVDPNCGYDPQNPRKPNISELAEALSRKSVENLYAETDGTQQKNSRQASNLLYGVVGANEDTRDWLLIMASEDIMMAAQEQTRIMYEPEVDINSSFDENDILTEQLAVIKDRNGNILRSLSSDISSTEETLLNFGVTKESIPNNLEDRVDPKKFDNDLLSFLKNFDNKPTSIQQVVIQSASEVIANKISQEIPLDELAKL